MRTAERGLCNGRASVRQSVCPIIRRPVGLLLSAPAGRISAATVACAQQQRRRRSAANAGSVVLSAELRQLNTDLYTYLYWFLGNQTNTYDLVRFYTIAASTMHA